MKRIQLKKYGEIDRPITWCLQLFTFDFIRFEGRETASLLPSLLPSLLYLFLEDFSSKIICQFYVDNDAAMIRKQYKFLEKDLTKASTNRHNRPWILAMGYHPFYCNSRDPKASQGRLYFGKWLVKGLTVSQDCLWKSIRKTIFLSWSRFKPIIKYWLKEKM